MKAVQNIMRLDIYNYRLLVWRKKVKLLLQYWMCHDNLA